MAVRVPIIVIMTMAGGVPMRIRPALTGRVRRHSAAGLAVVSATVLTLANLGQIIREGEA